MATIVASEDEAGLPEPAGMVGTSSIEFPAGYRVGVTRYADLILKHAFPRHFEDLVSVLAEYSIEVTEILSGGGARSKQTKRFDASLAARGWGKRRIGIEKRIDGELIHKPKSHEIDMFAAASEADTYPGVGVEMEWSNKDPFFDRDLLNFQALHREGAVGVGVVVTRGPELQRIISNTVFSTKKSKSSKYGESTTHWNKLVPRVNLGGGGECPLLLIGIEPERVNGFSPIAEAFEKHERIWKL